VSGFVDLGLAVVGVLEASPHEGEAVLESGFYLSNRGMDESETASKNYAI